MNAIELREELFREMNPMLDSKIMLQKMLAFVRDLFREQQVMEKQKQLDNLNHAFSQFHDMQEGKLEGINAEDLLNEL